jgi:hypothetical protein
MMTSTTGVNLVDRGNYPNQSSTSTASSSTTNSSNNININNNASNANPIVDFSVGSMPANYGYDESFSKDDEVAETQFKPRILIMGLRK